MTLSRGLSLPISPPDYFTPFTSLMDWLPYWKWGFPVISGLRGIFGIRTHAVRRLATAHPYVLLSQINLSLQVVNITDPIEHRYVLFL